MAERFSVTTRNGVTSLKRTVPFSPRLQQSKSSGPLATEHRDTDNKPSVDPRGSDKARKAS